MTVSHPSDGTNMEPMRIGSLFAGYGGLDLAIEQVFPGARPAWFCEWDDAPAKILAHHWPEVPNHRDVTAIDWAPVEPVDILAGGYPCQPFSAAGQRKGTDDERHLWPYVREAIRVLRPRYVVLENVAGHRSLGFDRVLGDMAEDGLDVRWTSVRASDIGAPHHRERLFILATPADTASFRLEAGKQPVRQSAKIPQHHGSGLPFRSRRGINRTVEWGRYAPTIRRWERALGTPAPAPTIDGNNGRRILNAEFASWMMGLPEGHVTNVDIPRAAQLKAIGNGVCPPQAAHALRALLAMPLPATQPQEIAA